MMDINIYQYLTFWNVALLILTLPLGVMLITMPFLPIIPEVIKQLVGISAILGFRLNYVAILYLVVITFLNVVDYSSQKTQLVPKTINGEFRMVEHYDPFDSKYLIYLIAFVTLAIASWVVLGLYASKDEFGSLRKPRFGANPLNLND